MHAPDCHPGSHHQSLGSNQALSYQGLHRARIQQRLVFTPLHPYRNAVHPLQTWAEVGGPTTWTTCPTSMSGHSRRKWPSYPHRQHSGPGVWGTPCGSGRTVTEPGIGGGKKRMGWDGRWNSPWPPGRGNGSQTRVKPPLWHRLQLLPLRVGGALDEVILGQGYGGLETGGPVALYPGRRGRGQPPPETAPGPPAPLRRPPSISPAAATSVSQVGQPLGISERAVPRCQDQLPELPPLFLWPVHRLVQHGLSDVRIVRPRWWGKAVGCLLCLPWLKR